MALNSVWASTPVPKKNCAKIIADRVLTRKPRAIAFRYVNVILCLRTVLSRVGGWVGEWVGGPWVVGCNT